MKKRFVALLLCLCMAIPLVGCGDNGGPGNTVVKDEKTINIKMVETGWGTDYIEDTIEKFEAIYAEEGYKVNLLPADPNFAGSAALGDMRLGYDALGYDLVISSGYTVQQLTDESYGVCVEPMNDVMTSKPIGFDGTEDENTIENLYNDTQSWKFKIGDTYWAVPYATDTRGLVCNMKVLNKYGITEMPATTDELFECFDVIYNGTSGKAGMDPVVWGGGNAYGYALPIFYNVIAQLMGQEEYEKFFALDYLLNDDGTIKADGYNHLNNDAVKEAINVAMHAFDTAYSVPGSISQQHSSAHAVIVTGKAAFMFDGVSFYNEVKNAFPSYLNDVRYCALPIASKLGVDLKLDGSGNREKCDEILSFMAKKVDEGKSAAEIKSMTETEFSISLTDEKVNRVIAARTTGHGGDGFLNIIKGTPKADIAKLFIRTLLSEDSAKETFSKYGMISATYSDVEPLNTNQFVIDTYKVNAKHDFLTTSSLYPNTVRAKTNLFLIPPYNAMFAVTFDSEMGDYDSPADRNYDLLTDVTFNKVTTTTKDKWSEYMAKGGYKLGN